VVGKASSSSSFWRWAFSVPGPPLVALFAFDLEESRTQHSLLLAVLGEGGLERGDLILQRNNRMPHVLSGFEVAKHIRHGDLNVIVARPYRDGGVGHHGGGSERRTQAFGYHVVSSPDQREVGTNTWM
jgi:hypothetical protein